MAFINVTLIDTKLSSYFYRFWSKSSLKYGVNLKFVSLLTAEFETKWFQIGKFTTNFRIFCQIPR